MPKSFKGFRAIAGFSAGALLLTGGSLSQAATKHHRRHHHHHHHAVAPTGPYVLKGLGTAIGPQGMGDISLPSALSPAQILQRFGAAGITTLGTATIAVHYPSNSPAGVTFNWTPGGSLYTIAISSPAYQTSQGLHVGSPVSQVQAAFPLALCGPYVCVTRTTAADGSVSVMSFDLDNGTVIQIDLSTEPASRTA